VIIQLLGVPYFHFSLIFMSCLHRPSIRTPGSKQCACGYYLAPAAAGCAANTGDRTSGLAYNGEVSLLVCLLCIICYTDTHYQTTVLSDKALTNFSFSLRLFIASSCGRPLAFCSFGENS